MNEEQSIRERMEKLQYISYRDALTGLYNRNYLTEKVNEYLQDRRAHGTLFMVDLDGFKLVNDTYGHIIGDEFLKNLAGKIQSSVREEDIVARIGGDEFIVFLRGALDKKAIEERAMRLIDAIDEGIEGMELQCQVTASVGVSSSTKEKRNFMALYDEADKALYLVKHNGKNGYYMYNGEGVFANAGDKPDISLLKTFIAERDTPKGAYSVEYDSFKRIYQFMTRYLARAEHEVQIVLFTLVNENGKVSDVGSDVMFNLERIIKESLRVGDVATNYSSSQFLVLLMDVSPDNAESVAERVALKFKEESNTDGVMLKYDIDTIK